MSPYHFVNFPKDANNYQQQRDCKQRNCVIEAIAWYVRVLKTGDAPRNEKRIALRFILHLVGDVHQPLHAGFAEDRGGNSVDVRFNTGKKTCTHYGIRLLLSWRRAHRLKWRPAYTPRCSTQIGSNGSKEHRQTGA